MAQFHAVAGEGVAELARRDLCDVFFVFKRLAFDHGFENKSSIHIHASLDRLGYLFGPKRNQNREGPKQ